MYKNSSDIQAQASSRVFDYQTPLNVGTLQVSCDVANLTFRRYTPVLPGNAPITALQLAGCHAVQCLSLTGPAASGSGGAFRGRCQPLSPTETKRRRAVCSVNITAWRFVICD